MKKEEIQVFKSNINGQHKGGTFKLCAGNKAYLVILKFYLGINQQKGDKRIGL